MVIKEALLQFNRITEKPFVEILNDNETFRKKNVEIGISDGLKVEIISGVTEDDKIKVWNKTEPLKIGDEEEEEEDQDN
jgi:HlyD family secretion protein